jgi:membrane fusion protein (multidrug efflux system)
VQAGFAATEKRDTPRKGRSRRPLALSLASVAGGGYVYWDNASHFESTDDAFIAARQFAMAPKVSGYITASIRGGRSSGRALI